MSIGMISDITEDMLLQAANFLEGFQTHDEKAHLRGAENLCFIARAVGPQRTRNEFLPFIQNFFSDGDEVLGVFSEELGKFVDLVGGSSFAYTLIRPLELLASKEDAFVRESACNSLITVLEAMPPADVASQGFDLVKRFCTSDWFTMRVSASCLFPAVYPHCLENQKEELLQMYSRLVEDPVQIVRNFAAQSLKNLIPHVEKVHLKGRIAEMMGRLSQDTHDAIRLWMMGAVVAAAKQLTSEETCAVILPIARCLAKDNSWRVRYKAAELIDGLCASPSVNEVRQEIIPIYLELLGDSEPVVKTEASARLASVCERLPAEVIVKQILPPIKEIAKDDGCTFKETLVVGVMAVSSLLTKSEFNREVLPLLLDFLSDRESIEVRQTVLANLSSITKVLDLNQISARLVPAIESLTSDDIPWRVRVSVMSSIPLVATEMHEAAFKEKLLPMCLDWVCDGVVAVRKAGMACLCEVGKVFGPEWVGKNLMPFCCTLCRGNTHKERQTGLACLGTFAAVCSEEYLFTQALPAVSGLSRDVVPNVRLNAADTLGILIRIMTRTAWKKEAIATLERMASSDSDADVKYRAAQALKDT
ncbi:putative protein phosphatase 2A subunit A2 [Monocercomonoides exilis]|uniref:putative protein phosphatase 2A subunit A2 n=1 Tax=Monocercomonoides exilis TaxID=2049356 RepID=UPI003559881A|nr:putative protein phosphatase 2A subunit A2 [Monocercomonoides exilis]|eukprot:MONOS_4153.1-p1 / transcript=MONOS_4153.1 / gene=MONOS_4153 / organism=Monocercomonoides_exilis_PA203 / gene_product=protein phosphatase 2A subunit A2 / transcript_product=protein phosphatase 2A subunit A2 / location=Mono_scaffold00106:91884-94577(-) / protein_length=589 / sequence_SO=supercontig / SO=protein_coding / is_pseudo=false